MADIQLLEEKFEDSGKTKTHLSKKISVSRPRLNYIFKHPESATLDQADGLSKELSINATEKRKIFYP